MVFYGISREFSLKNEDQYNTIGDFWEKMGAIYGLENLQGLGYMWKNSKIYYAIGLKNGIIESCNFTINLPDDGWIVVDGNTDDLKMIYDEIYKSGSLKYEIETVNIDGKCQIKYIRENR